VAIKDLPPAYRDRDSSAEELFSEYSSALIAKNFEVLDLMFSDELMIQRADGSWNDKLSFLERPTDLRSFAIDNPVERRGVNVIVARFDATGEYSINGTEYGTFATPMLVVFEWAEGHWALQALANFNRPQ